MGVWVCGGVGVWGVGVWGVGVWGVGVWGWVCGGGCVGVGVWVWVCGGGCPPKMGLLSFGFPPPKKLVPKNATQVGSSLVAKRIMAPQRLCFLLIWG